MRGRPRKPAYLRMIEGDTRNRGVNKHNELLAAEPIPLYPLGEAPESLDDVGKEVWYRITRELPRGMLRSTDCYLVESYCNAVSLYREAHDKLKKSSMLIKDPSGHARQSPYLAIMNTQSRIMHKLGSELGLSPVARTRISIPEGERDPDPLDRFFND